MRVRPRMARLLPMIHQACMARVYVMRPAITPGITILSKDNGRIPLFLPKPVERILQAVDSPHVKTFDRLTRCVRLGNYCDGKPELGRLAQPFLSARCRPHFARQAHFAKGDQPLG